jgi:hypothetical protein
VKADFTVETYRELLEALRRQSFSFQTVEQFMTDPLGKVVILRHDVDERPRNALSMAQIEYRMGIRASYYFRILEISNDPEVIAEIARMGHEIGYHYEDLALAGGDLEVAIRQFAENLAYFQKFYPVKTICMHGSSMSSHDNKILWDRYDFKDFGIIVVAGRSLIIQ